MVAGPYYQYHLSISHTADRIALAARLLTSLGGRVLTGLRNSVFPGCGIAAVPQE